MHIQAKLYCMEEIMILITIYRRGNSGQWSSEAKFKPWPEILACKIN